MTGLRSCACSTGSVRRTTHRDCAHTIEETRRSTRLARVHRGVAEPTPDHAQSPILVRV